ncbi:MAG: polysaccharide deacetylase family protein [Flavobacteriales bacterium]
MQIVKVPQLIQYLFPSIIWKGKTDEKILHLTFDDSPTSEFTYWILNLLEKLNIKATFFCVGESAEKYPKIILSILDKGHQIGNHTYSHKNGFLSCNKSYLQDVEKCRNVMPNTNLFRPPYGKITPFQIRKVKENYKIIMWDVLSYDFDKKITEEKVKSNVLNNVENGSIIVFHDNKKSKKILKLCLEEILQNLIKKGYRFKTI